MLVVLVVVGVVDLVGEVAVVAAVAVESRRAVHPEGLRIGILMLANMTPLLQQYQRIAAWVCPHVSLTAEMSIY